MTAVVALRSRSDMRPLQVRCVAAIAEQKRVMLALNTGYGKTCIALTSLVDLNQATGKRNLMLYVAPPAVAASVPVREAATWAHLSHLKVVTLTGTPAQRLGKLKSGDFDVLSISYNMLGWLIENASAMPVPDVLVADELSKAKSITSQTHRRLVAISRSVEIFIGMVALPAARGHQDLYGQMVPIDFGKRLGRTFGEFTARWFVPHGVFGDFRVRNSQSAQEINEAIADVALSPRDDERVDLPALVELRHEVELVGEARTEYERTESGLLLGKPIDPATILGRLAQLADGCVYGTDGQARFIHSAKLDRLVDLVDEIAEPVIVVYRYRHIQAEILKRVKGATAWDPSSAASINRTIDDFAAGRIPVLVAHSASFGHGIDGLQKGARHLIWFGPPLFSLELKLQTQGRLHRPGVKDTVFIHSIDAAGTVDQVINAVLAGRMKGQDQLIETLASYLQNKHGKRAGDDLADRLKQARRDVQRAHPDLGGSSAEFIKAKAELDRLKKAAHP